MMIECPDCGGDGKETCSNPDHGFIGAAGGDIGRIGCPCCGHDPDHKVPGGGKCEACNGTGEVSSMSEANTLPSDPSERGQYPMADGLLYYFPAALAAVSRVSKIGNDQHNPGEPLHWARDKSTDHANKILRHLVDAGSMDSDGTRHSAKLAWRALALLQEEMEREEGAPLPRNARFSTPIPAATFTRQDVVKAYTRAAAVLGYDAAGSVWDSISLKTHTGNLPLSLCGPMVDALRNAVAEAEQAAA